jgi:hypothetical protein
VLDQEPVSSEHPRDPVTRKAMIEMAEALIWIKEQHGLSSAEFLFCLSSVLYEWASMLKCMERKT